MPVAVFSSFPCESPWLILFLLFVIIKSHSDKWYCWIVLVLIFRLFQKFSFWPKKTLRPGDLAWKKTISRKGACLRGTHRQAKIVKKDKGLFELQIPQSLAHTAGKTKIRNKILSLHYNGPLEIPYFSAKLRVWVFSRLTNFKMSFDPIAKTQSILDQF